MNDRLETDPTPEEIRQRCLAIQANWTKEERAKRRGGAQRFRMPKGTAKRDGTPRKIGGALSYEAQARIRSISSAEMNQIILDNRGRVTDENFIRTKH